MTRAAAFATILISAHVGCSGSDKPSLDTGPVVPVPDQRSAESCKAPCNRECEKDSDCTLAPGKLCNTVTGRCVSCRSSADCVFSPEGPACDAVFGVCRACATPTDCADNPRGATCSVAPDPPGCTCKSGSDCKGTTAWGPKCVQAPSGAVRCGCESSADCALDAHGPSCDREYGICSCTSDADCTTPPNTSCATLLPGTNVKQCKKPCTSKAECNPPWTDGTLSCVDGKCVECETDKDCPAGFARLCVQGRCVACKSNADCTRDPLAPACDLATGMCGPCKSALDCTTSPFGGTCITTSEARCGCTTAADCSASSLGKACLGTGAPRRCGCTTDGDCTGNPRGPTCNIALGECSCTGDSQCTSAPYTKCYGPMSPSTFAPAVHVKQCQKPCAVDTECVDVDPPKCVSGKCGGCSADAGCGLLNKLCGSDGTCVACKADNDCLAGMCDTVAGRCVACKTDANCTINPDAKHCNVAKGGCVPCLTDAHCTTPLRPLCDVLMDSCVECRTSADCTGAALGNTCNGPSGSGVCRCASDAGCAANPNGHYCVPKVYVCGCQSAADCPGGKPCKPKDLPGVGPVQQCE